MATQIFVSGKVFTGLAEDSFAVAFRVTDDVFTWVGDRSGAETEPARDLEGKMVMPGFLKCPHPSGLPLYSGRRYRLPATRVRFHLRSPCQAAIPSQARPRR